MGWFIYMSSKFKCIERMKAKAVIHENRLSTRIRLLWKLYVIDIVAVVCALFGSQNIAAMSDSTNWNNMNIRYDIIVNLWWASSTWSSCSYTNTKRWGSLKLLQFSILANVYALCVCVLFANATNAPNISSKNLNNRGVNVCIISRCVRRKLFAMQCIVELVVPLLVCWPLCV